MVIHNREERSTAIWRFIGVAAIGLLLFFFAGFSLGDTSAEEKINYKELHEKESVLLDSLQNKVKAYNAFFARTATLLKTIEKTKGELDADLAAAANSGDAQGLFLWKEKDRAAFDGFDDSIHLAKRAFKSVENDPVVKSGVEFLNKYLSAEHSRLLKQHTDLTKQLAAGNAQELQATLAAIQTQKAEMEKLGVQQSKDNELADVREDLKSCRAELAQLQKGSTGAGSQNKEAVARIKEQIKIIQVQMLPNIADSRFKNDSRKLTQLKDQISGSLTNISTELITIK